MKAVTAKQPQRAVNWLNFLMAVTILLILVLGCNKGTFSKAQGKASNLVCKGDVGIVKGQPDAGVTVTVTVKNVREAGFINIKPQLSTSEGEWSRSQDVHFDAGESKTLTYFFDEPTINATNIQCRIGISPNAD